MRKNSSALNELRNKLHKEEKQAKKAKLFIKPFTIEEIRSFIDEKAEPVFNLIKEEVAPHAEKVVVQKYKYTISLLVTEGDSSYYCNLKFSPSRRTATFSSSYRHQREPSSTGRIVLNVSLLRETKEFQDFCEITPEYIIGLFNRSYFSRIKEVEKILEEEKEHQLYDQDGDLIIPEESL